MLSWLQGLSRSVVLRTHTGTLLKDTKRHLYLIVIHGAVFSGTWSDSWRGVLHSVHGVRAYSKTSSNMAQSTTRPVGSRRMNPQDYNYFLVLDFEATCNEGKKIHPQEIIEFPVLKVSGETFLVESTFHQYVSPEVNKELTPFCTQLTGIIQEMVDGQPTVTETLKSFNEWMQSEGLLEPDVKSVFVTCGDWDLNVMLPSQSRNFNFRYPTYLKQWINIKKSFCEIMHKYPKGMMPMLADLGIQHEGRHHSGIDDCKNIAKILKGLAERGYIFAATGRKE